MALTAAAPSLLRSVPTTLLLPPEPRACQAPGDRWHPGALPCGWPCSSAWLRAGWPGPREAEWAWQVSVECHRSHSPEHTSASPPGNRAVGSGPAPPGSVLPDKQEFTPSLLSFSPPWGNAQKVVGPQSRACFSTHACQSEALPLAVAWSQCQGRRACQALRQKQMGTPANF